MNANDEAFEDEASTPALPTGRMPGWRSIYILYDPRTGPDAGRYIGAAADPDKRLRGHLRDARSGSTKPVYIWLAAMLAEGIEPKMDVLMWVPAKMAWFVEQREIRAARMKGMTIYNAQRSRGGEGMPRRLRGTRAAEQEPRQLLTAEERSAITREAMNRPEVKARHSAATREAMNRPEVKARHSAALARPEVKVRHSAAMREVMARPEVKARNREALARNREVMARPEMRARMREAFASPEARARLAETARACWADPEYRARHREAMARPEVKAKLVAALARRRAEQDSE
jgi:hypothetical protein